MNKVFSLSCLGWCFALEAQQELVIPEPTIPSPAVAVLAETPADQATTELMLTLEQQVRQVADKYADALSCGEHEIIGTLPWTTSTEGEGAMLSWLVLWAADLGCYGGSGSYAYHLTLVEKNVGGLFVNAKGSSPVIRIKGMPSAKAPVSGIEKISDDQIKIFGMDYGPDDARCCPSRPVAVILQRDKQGNWQQSVF
ncbi:hypothetical protein [Rheinheimera sp.]|uniref:hypothetical protein n=1 Tax=Rheinheimera sp. TaxID=1869214 RepID=UPI00307E7C25